MGNEFNTGVERSVMLTDSIGRTFKFTDIVNVSGTNSMGGDLVRFASEPVTRQVNVPSISTGLEKTKAARVAWRGTMTISRISGFMDALEAEQQQRWVTQQQALTFTIDEYTTNTDDQSLDHFQYPNATVWMTSAGQWELERPTEITLEFQATQRINVGGTPV